MLNYGTATYLCSKESKNSTPYSASPVEALQELNTGSRAESGSLDETLLPISIRSPGPNEAYHTTIVAVMTVGSCDTVAVVAT